MKKFTTNVILWLFSLFTLLLALVSFSESILAGILFLAAAVLTNPVFLKILRKHRIRFKKIIYIPAVIFIWFLGMYAFPTSGSNNSAQTQEYATTAESDIISGDIAEDIADEADAVEDIADEADEADVVKDTVNGSDSTENMIAGADSATDGELSDLSIHFIDVGQGDATLIMCDGHAMLIDTGDNSKGTTLQL